MSAPSTPAAGPGFGRELLRGRLRLDLLDPVPDPGPDPAGEAFLARLADFCAGTVDPRAIERDDRIPDEVVEGLRDLGAFAVRLPAAYGGLGLPGVYWHRALMLVSSTHASLGELLAAHQAIGLAQPLLVAGTERQRRDLLPRCVREIAAFALTEPDVGNDPYPVRTTAVPTGDGRYRIDGLKLWTTNGVVADLLVVVATVPPGGSGDGGLTAFVVDAADPGVRVVHRSSFLGLRGLENGVIRLDGVLVPAGRRIGGEGDGLQVALAAQETGRLSLPAVCAAAAKWSLRIAREWTGVRVQWGRPIGELEAVAAKLAGVAATAFALEAVVEVTGRHADAGRDTAVEAELAKLFATERAWRVADELMQIRGGRGYETAESAAARGERGVPVEQLLRDVRVGRIFDGSSEALRVFVASGAAAQDGPAPGGPPPAALHPGYGALGGHLRWAERTARDLARQLADGRRRWGEAVAERHLFLGCVADVAAELYAVTASCVYARHRGGTAGELADAVARQARDRVAARYAAMWADTGDDLTVARRVRDGRYTWLEDGVLDPSIDGPWIADPSAQTWTGADLRRRIGR